MAQADLNVANQSGSAFRADLNNQLLALGTLMSGASAPSTTYAYMLWADTTAGQLKIRNAANSAWITLRQLDGILIIEGGSAAAPGAYFSGDSNTGLYSPGADQVAISTAGTGRLFVTSAGLVGVGVSSPSSTLTVGGNPPIGGAIGAVGSAGGIALALSDNTNSSLYVRTASGGAVIGTDTGGLLRFAAGGNAASDEKMRLDSIGRLLVGTSSARSNFYNGTDTGLLQVEGADDVTKRFSSFIYGRNNADGPLLLLGKHRGNSVGGTTVVSLGDEIGRITFQGSDGTEFVPGAEIYAYVDGTPGANVMPGRLVFSVTRDGASSPTEALRINNQGAVATFSAEGNTILLANSRAAGTSDNLIAGSHSATGVISGTTSFIVRTNGNVLNTNNSYGSLSDAKLKENVADAGSQWADLKAIEVKNFNFIGDEKRHIGVIAQQVELVSPGLVDESIDYEQVEVPVLDAYGNPVYKTEEVEQQVLDENGEPVVDEDGNPVMETVTVTTEQPETRTEQRLTGTVTKSVKYSVLYMKAIKALQEAMERIEALEGKVAALEAA